jgi:hypothetical protein
VYFVKLNVDVGIIVATSGTRELSLTAQGLANNYPFFLCDIEETYFTGNKGEFLRSITIYVKGNDSSRRHELYRKRILREKYAAVLSVLNLFSNSLTKKS